LISSNDIRMTAVPSACDPWEVGDFLDRERSLDDVTPVPGETRRSSGLKQSASSLITWRVKINAAQSSAPCSELMTMKMYHSTIQSVNAATKPSVQPRPITTDNFT